MKTVLLAILVCSHALSAQLVNAELIKIRELYYRASLSPEKCEQFGTYLTYAGQIDKNLKSGYVAMFKMLTAKFVWNPFQKLNYFNAGKNQLEEAIQASGNDVELRFLRYCAQRNAPFFLNYSGKIAEDRKLLEQQWPQLSDRDLKTRIRNYLKLTQSAQEENTYGNE